MIREAQPWVIEFVLQYIYCGMKGVVCAAKLEKSTCQLPRALVGYPETIKRPNVQLFTFGQWVEVPKLMDFLQLDTSQQVVLTRIDAHRCGAKKEVQHHSTQFSQIQYKE